MGRLRAKRLRNLDDILERALELGAVGAKFVEPGNVITATWVRLKCQYGCGGYGQRLTCPPYSPTPDVTRRMVNEYRHVLLIHCKAWTDVRKLVAELEREAFYAGFYKAFGMGAGPCYLCDKCALEKGCRHPDMARPSMEACGIDVYATARLAGFPIDVVPPEGGEENYYGLLLID